MKNAKPIEILLIEDNMGDIDLVTEALRDSKVKNKLNVVKDGVEAMKYMHQEGKYKNSKRPDLIFLDINMPKKNGMEVLKDLKSDKNFLQIPVVVMTTSEDESDIAQSYGLHANSYVTKPVDFEKFTNVVKSIEHFWFSIVELPKEG